jgi:hypothetical protein
MIGDKGDHAFDSCDESAPHTLTLGVSLSSRLCSSLPCRGRSESQVVQMARVVPGEALASALPDARKRSIDSGLLRPFHLEKFNA